MRTSPAFTVQLDLFSLLGILFTLLYIDGSEGRICLRCSDVPEPRFCDRIEYCNSGEVCATRRYRRDNGDYTYWAGCASKSVCSTVSNGTVLHHRKRAIDGVVVCNECCDSDLCNVNGCGGPSYPMSRGPICFDCSSVLNPTDCHRISICGTNEHCYLGERPIFGQRYFTSRCESVHACNAHLSAPAVVGRKRSLMKKSYTPCMGCCNGDLCNTQCNATFTPGTNVNTGQNTNLHPSTTVASTSQAHIAFYAILTRNQGSGIIVFDQVITNIGSWYDSSTGVFSVASSGVYVFSWNVETESQLTNTTLEVNGVEKGTATADEIPSSHYDTSTSFAVLELKAGDRVAIRVKRGSAVSFRTAFSGWRYSNSLKDHRFAFYTSLSRKVQSTPFVFDNVYTNQDSVYTASTGKFQAKSPGLYIFTTSLSAFSGSMTDSYLYIRKGSSTVKGYPITLNSYSGHYDTTATMTLAYLNTGDQVYIGDNSAAATSMFAGWLAAPGSPSNYPAFTASLRSDSSSTPLVFDKSHVDPHNGYSTSTGKFTAGKAGVYVFFWNVRADNGLVESALRVNSRDLGRTRSEGRSTADFDDSSSVAVVQLSVGDEVFVHMIAGTADEGQSAFCGWLLYEN